MHVNILDSNTFVGWSSLSFLELALSQKRASDVRNSFNLFNVLSEICSNAHRGATQKSFRTGTAFKPRL